MPPKPTLTAKPAAKPTTPPTKSTSKKAGIMTIVLTVLATAVVVFVILAVIGSRSPSSKTPTTQTPSATAPVTRPIVKGTDDPKRVVSVDKALAKLLVDYRDAQIMSNALFLVKLEETKLEDYKSFCDQVIAKWTDVEADSAALDPYAKEQVTLRRSVRDLFRIPAAQAQETEVQLEMPKWDKVAIVKAAAPSISTIKLVQDQFGGTAKEAKDLIEQHYQAEAKSWGNWATGFDIASKSAQTLKTTSKVALFVGGTVITAGGAAVLTMPAGAALATGFAAPVASLGYVGGTITAINGADTILAVNETVSSVAFGDEKSAAVFAEMQKKISPLTTVVGIVSLKDGMDDPGNLVTAYDWASWGYDKLTADVSSDSVTFHPGTLPVSMPSLTSDGLLNTYVVPNTPYRIVFMSPNAPAATQPTATQPATPIAIAPAGTYAGNATFKVAIPQIGTRTFTYDLTVTVDVDGSTAFDIKGGGTMTFSPIPQMTITYPYSLSSKLEGTTDANGTTGGTGSFTSSAKVIFPKNVPMPPEYQNLNSTATGNATAKGSISAGSGSGTITLSASNGSTPVTGTWEATKK